MCILKADWEFLVNTVNGNSWFQRAESQEAAGQILVECLRDRNRSLLNGIKVLKGSKVQTVPQGQNNSNARYCKSEDINEISNFKSAKI